MEDVLSHRLFYVGLGSLQSPLQPLLLVLLLLTNLLITQPGEPEERKDGSI